MEKEQYCWRYNIGNVLRRKEAWDSSGPDYAVPPMCRSKAPKWGSE